MQSLWKILRIAFNFLYLIKMAISISDALMAMLIAKGTDQDPKDILVEAARLAKSASKESKKDPAVEQQLESDISDIYAAYPSRDDRRGASTGKCEKCRVKIRQLLTRKSKPMTKEHILTAMRHYLDDCTASGAYIKNFQTFLNNIPDVVSTETPFQTPITEQGTIWQ